MWSLVSSSFRFQSDNLLSYLTVEETLTYTAQLALRKHSAEAIKKKVTHLGTSGPWLSRQNQAATKRSGETRTSLGVSDVLWASVINTLTSDLWPPCRCRRSWPS